MTMMSLFRPLTPREIAQWTVRIYTRYWPQWIMLAALALVPMMILNVAAMSVLPQPEFDPAVFEQVLDSLESGQTSAFDSAAQQELMTNLLDNSVLMLQQVIFQLLTQIVLIGVVLGGAGAVMTSSAFHGRPVSLGEAVRVLSERAAALLGGHLVLGIGLIVLFILSMLGLLICVGMIGLGLSVYMYLAAIPLLAPVLALERGPLSTLLRRTWQFGKRRVWVILGVVLALFLLRFVLTLPLDIMTRLLVGDSMIAAQILTIVVEAITLPLGAIFYTLLYEDTRSQLEMPEEESETATRPPSMAVEPIITPADVPNIVGISFVAIGLFFALYLLAFLQVGASFLLPF